MVFEILSYENSSGKNPIEEFLDEIKKKNAALWSIVIAKIQNLKDLDYHNKHSKPLKGGLFELKIAHFTGIVRILYCFEGKGSIRLINGFIKKDVKQQSREIEKARKIIKKLKV